MTITSLPLAEMKAPFVLAVQQAFGVGLQKLHREMDAFQLAPFDGQIARLGRAGAKHDGVEFPQELLGRIIPADLGVGEELTPSASICSTRR